MEALQSPAILTVVGAGRLGRTLARLWADSGVFTIGDVITRTAESASNAVAFIGQGQPLTTDLAPDRVEAVLLAVPDDQLPTVAAWLAEHAVMAPGATAFHCSGALDASALTPLRNAGAAVASAHPMYSFADPTVALAGFPGTYCALEGDAAAVALVEKAFTAIGGRPLRIDAAGKLLYHAGGVFAANYVTVLVDVAMRLVETAGIPRDKAGDLLAPLLRSAVESALEFGPGPALTGPVVRGDSALVGRQAEDVMRHDRQLGALYRSLGRAAVALARHADRLDAPACDRLLKALADPE